MNFTPIPEGCFIKLRERLRTIKGQRRWRSADGERIYTWDGLHGEVEVFNKRGRHIAVYDCDENLIKPAVKSRKIDV